MTPYRGSDDDLERELAALRRLVAIRLRHATAELRELETAVVDLRRELRRRRELGTADVGAAAPSTAST